VSAAVVAEARARLAGAWPNAADRTGEAAAAPESGLPAFAVELEMDEAEPRAQRGGWQLSGRLTVRLWAAPDPASARADMEAAADSAIEAIMAAPERMGGLLADLVPAGTRVDVEGGRRRLAALDVEFDVVRIEDGTAPAPPAALGL